MHHSNAANVDAPGKAADQNDFAGDGDGADQCHHLAFAHVQATGLRPGEQYQPNECQAYPKAGHQARAPTQHQPLQQGYEGHVKRRDERRLAAADRLQAHGLQAVAQHDQYANRQACLEFDKG